MLTYRLNGTTQASGSTTTNQTSLDPTHPSQQAPPNLRAPRCAFEDGAALLTCDDALSGMLANSLRTCI